jgi:hypothetical protein
LTYTEADGKATTISSNNFFLKVNNISDEEFGSGISTLNTGFCSVILKSSSTFPASSEYQVFVLTDQMLMVNKEYITSTKRF